MMFKLTLITLFCLTGLNANANVQKDVLAAELTRPAEIEAIGPVQDIVVLHNTISWSAPVNSGLLRLTYFVEILDGGKVINSLRTELLSAGIYSGLVPCNDYTARITLEYGSHLGLAKEVLFTAPAEAHLPPTHVETVPSLASATVKLQGNRREQNSCPINEVMVLCYEATSSNFFNVTKLVEDNEDRLFEITLPDLSFNTHYSCNAQLMPQTSLFSDSFQFDTLNIPIKDVEVSDITSNTFTLSWDEPKEIARYVSMYTLAITAVGPNHFVQSTCNMERNVTYYVEVPANELTYTFADALPNYKYHIAPVTKYNIGVNSVGDTATVNTLPGIPGRIITLGGRLSQEECQRYSAVSTISWSPPCDINGELDRFEVIVTSLYNIGDEALEHRQHRTLLPSDANEFNQFQMQIPLNPFFRYSVSVDVFGAFPGTHRALMPSIIPPAAFGPCSS